MSPSAAIALHDVTVCYQRHPAVHHLSGVFHTGSLTAIAGPNGAGKSTLLKAIMGLLPLTTGQIEIIGAARAQTAYLPQQTQIDREFPMRVLDVVHLGHWPRIGAWGGITSKLEQQALSALSAVGLSGFEQRPIRSLSVGQFQRMLFARILVQDAPMILLDEPFNALDAKTTADLLGILTAWHQQGRTVIAVLHDFVQVRAHFPQTLLLARREIAWGDTAQVLTPEHLHRAGCIAEAWDDRAPWCGP